MYCIYAEVTESFCSLSQRNTAVTAAVTTVSERSDDDATNRLDEKSAITALNK
jgi:hypothetical protein